MENKILWYIWSNEHRMWWNPFRCGYTNSKENAGKYKFDEAVKIVKDANLVCQNNWEPNETMVPCLD